MQNMKKYALYSILLILISGFSAGLGVLERGGISGLIWRYQMEKIDDTIRINEETTIYTLDETYKIGSL